VFANANTDRAKSVEFVLVGVITPLSWLCFSAR